MAPIRLLALDIDGTLLRSDGTVAPSDRAALAAARERGMTITLATGRLSSSALPFARELGLEAPLVCADGAVLFCPSRAIPLVETALAAPGLEVFLGSLRKHALAPFVFTHEAVCGARTDLARFPFVSGWTDRFTDARQRPNEAGVITAIGIGPSETIAAVHDALRAHPEITDDVSAYPIRTTAHWVVRLSPGGCTKAVGLALLAERLQIAQAEVAAVGDYYNDVTMLSWAGHSFAMGQAPDEVKQAARHALVATSDTGGAIAEALALLDRR